MSGVGHVTKREDQQVDFACGSCRTCGPAFAPGSTAGASARPREVLEKRRWVERVSHEDPQAIIMGLDSVVVLKKGA
jgi:hypothetical protein